MGFIAFKIIIISNKKRIVHTDAVDISDLTSSRQRGNTRVFLRFYDMTLSTEYQQRHMIKLNMHLGASYFHTC